MGLKENVAAKLFEALSREPHIYIIERGDGETSRVIESILRDEGLWGLVRKEETDTLVIYYVDKSKLVRLCSYEACSNIGDAVEFESCIQGCVQDKISSVLRRAGPTSGTGAWPR